MSAVVEVVDRALVTADEINHEHRLAQASAADAVTHAVQCGELLIEQKRQTAHGEWEMWVTDNCEFSPNRATRYMKAAKLALTQDLDDEGRLAISRDIWGNESRAHVANNSGENEWYTPPEFIAAARVVMGGIDLDPASSDLANQCVEAETYYTAQDNGLDQEWFGRIWLNPPYAQPLIAEFSDAVVSKRGDYEAACILVNNATDTGWLQDMLRVADAVCFLKGRVKFIDKHGEPSGAPLQGQVILYMGKNPAAFAGEFSRFGWVSAAIR